jgi:hypothetical protein
VFILFDNFVTGHYLLVTILSAQQLIGFVHPEPENKRCARSASTSPSRINHKIDGVQGDLNRKIDGVRDELGRKIDAVASDLTAHCRDTEAHTSVYKVKEG